MHSHNLILFLEPREKPQRLNEMCSKEAGALGGVMLYHGPDWKACQIWAFTGATWRPRFNKSEYLLLPFNTLGIFLAVDTEVPTPPFTVIAPDDVFNNYCPSGQDFENFVLSAGEALAYHSSCVWNPLSLCHCRHHSSLLMVLLVFNFSANAFYTVLSSYFWHVLGGG